MKIVLFRKRAILAGILVVVITLCAVIFSNSIISSAMSNISGERQLPIYRVKRDDKKISISFDAAWGNEDTAEIIDILEKYNVKATFFVVGEWVDKYPESVRALYDAGHEIMDHSDTHPHMTGLSAEEMLSEVNSCADKIANITGVRPTLFRPPFGDYNDLMVSTLSQAGYYTIQWDVDSLDWKNLTSEQIAKRVLEKVQTGSIVLFHNAALNTPEALPQILESLISQGYEFVKISELIYTENYKIDHTGQQYIQTSEESSGSSVAGVNINKED